MYIKIEEVVTLKKVIAGVLLGAQIINVGTALAVSKLSHRVELEEVKTVCGEQTLTVVFLGLMGNIDYLDEICAKIPGRVYYFRCPTSYYDPERLTAGTLEALEVILADASNRKDLKVNCVGVSLGALVATSVAEHLCKRYADLDVQVYLLNPCMGSGQIGMVKWPHWQKQGLANVISVAVGVLGWLGFIPCLDGEHSLANVQGELQTLARSVEAYPRTLVGRTHVIVSAYDEMVDAGASAEYFAAHGVDVANIYAKHCDFANNLQQYLDCLHNYGLVRL